MSGRSRTVPGTESGLRVLVFLAAFVVLASGRLRRGAVDVENSIDSIDGGGRQERTESRQSWGLPDAVVTAGKMFEYRLDEEAGGNEADNSGDEEWKGKIGIYQVNDEGEMVDLPDWLVWDPVKSVLEGVPPHKLDAKDYQIMVTNYRWSNEKDQFNIKVIEDTTPFDIGRPFANRVPSAPQQDAEVIPAIRCPPGGTATTVTVILDASEDKLTGAERVRLIRNASSHFGLPATSLRLRGPPADRPLLDLGSALTAGQGDSSTLPAPGTGILLEWDVGCGNVRAELMPSLELLETSAVDGRLRRSVDDRPVVGWFIANRRRQSSSPRRDPKNARWRPTYVVRPTATPILLPTAVRPTARPDLPTMTVAPPLPRPTLVPTASFVGPSASRVPVMPSRSKDVVLIEATVTMTYGPSMVAPTASPSGIAIRPTKVVGVSPSASVTWPRGSTDSTGSEVPSEGWWTRPDVLQPSVSMLETTASHRMATTGLPNVDETTEEYDEEDEYYEGEYETTPEYNYDYEEESTVEMQRETTEAMTTTTTTRATTTKYRKPPKTPRPIPENNPPEVRKEIGRISVIAGEVLSYVIPNETFYDIESGGAHDMELLFLTHEQMSIPRNSWVQFNQSSRTLYGMPMDTDVGQQSFLLAAVDLGGKIVRTSLDLDVKKGRSLDGISHEFSVLLDIDYNDFTMMVERRIDVAKKIAAVYGDKDLKNIAVTRIERGSVVYAWTNNSIPADGTCPSDQIKALSSRVVDPNDPDKPTKEFVDAMRPYPVKSVGARPLGPCLDDDDDDAAGPFQRTTPTPAVKEPDGVKVQKSDVGGDGTLWMLILVGAIVVGIVFLLLIVVCVVCCCRSRRMSEKQRRQRDEELSCANKGIPVIFADELLDDDEEDDEDRKTHMSTTPADTPASTLKRRIDHGDGTDGAESDGGPVVPPPEYPRSDPGSRTSTLRSDYKAPLLSEDDDDDDDGYTRGANGDGNCDTLPPYRKS